MRQVTDRLPTGPVLVVGPPDEHKSWMTNDPEPPTRPRERVRRSPHRKYQSPEEMWAWHWVKMRVVLAWSAVATSCAVAVTAGSVILSEFV